MAKKTHQPQDDMFEKHKLKEHARKAEAKYPPLEADERRALEEVWKLCLKQAAYGLAPKPPARPNPPFIEGGLRDRTFTTLPPPWKRPLPPSPDPNPAATQRSQAYWASYRKCEACPGPNRRRARYAFGAATNVGHTPDGMVT